ncbi:mitogen-activated protein kinase binding protein 1 [Dissophora ornata]|nr:mitogen-activated protein kinase binding protein 1 [Dissophora ornata]
MSGSLPASPAMRRKRKETECLLKLERVLGLTSNKPMILSVNSTHDLVAYAAGCVVVLYNHKLNKQVGLLCSSTLKKQPSNDSNAIGSGTATGATVGPGATGSGSRAIASFSSPRMAMSNHWTNSPLASLNINPLAGVMPMAISDGSVTSSFGTSNPSSNKNIKPKPISCLSFSPDGQFLAIGETGHQPRILIWDVVSHMLVGELQGHKFGVQAVHFSPNSRLLVSLGFQHDGYIHVWNWRTGLQISSNRVTTKVNALAFSADGSCFVTAGLRHVKFWYLNVELSKRGGLSGTAPNIQVLDGRSVILGELRDGNFLDAVCSKDGRFTYAVTSNGILCLFSEGRALEKWIDLHVRGAYSVNLDEKFVVCACTDGIIRLFEPETLEYIESLPKPLPVGAFSGAMQPNAQEEDSANPVYADVLASQYDVSSGCLICIYSDRSLFVWDISDPKNAILSRSHMFHSDCVWGSEILPTSDDEGIAHQFPAGTFVTYSADGSIKFWNLDESISRLPPISGAKDDDTSLRMFSREILKVLYVDKNCKSWIQAPENQNGMEPGFNIVPLECGIRTVKISSDGRFLASGDKGGNLRVHSLSTLQQVTYQEAHDTEILTIGFTDPTEKDSPFLVATAGRDRLLHIFDANNGYALVQTLDDHSSSITCIKFTADGSRMMSCGADKSIVFRNCHKNTDGISYQPYHQAPGRATFYDMSLNDASQTLSVVSGDRRFNIFALDTGKAIKSFKAETKGDDLTGGMAEICSMTHISLDPTGTIAAASGSDKSIRIYDLLHGTCLAHTICHSELVTSVKFMKNFDRIISTSADGCVLVWRLSNDVVRRIHNRIQENVTLPGHIQAKAAEKMLAPNMPAATPSPRTLKFKRSTDRLIGAYANENFGTSRRNSAASVMSEDCDIRSEENSDDLNEQHQSGTPKDAKVDDVSKESFAPVTVRAPGARSRVTGSISKTPLTRPRQSSSPKPGASRSQPSSSRSGALHDPPRWNRNFVKERIAPSPSAVKSTQPVSPGLHTPKNAAKGTWLTPKTRRPRANSLTVPTETTLKSNDAKAKDLSKQRQSLSDYTGDDPPEKEGENDDDGLSDETEPVLDNGPESAPPVHHAVGGTLKTNRMPTKGLGHDLPALKIKPHVRSSTTDGVLMSRFNESDRAVSESDPLEGNGVSEERDEDDEEADGDDSISETGSDNEILSPLQRRNVGPGGIQDLGESIGDFVSFQDGERLKDSPQSERSYQVTSPSGHHPVVGRRSLSSKFLMANAAMIMMGLTKQPLHSSSPEAGDDSRDSGSGSGQEVKGDSLIQGSFDNPLEGHPNLQSLNSAAMKWKHRSLGAEPRTVSQGNSLDQSGNTHAGLKSDDCRNEVERTRHRLTELGYLTAPSGTVQVQSSSESGVTAKTPTEPQEGSSAAALHPEAKVAAPTQLRVGVLASPVVVNSLERNKPGLYGAAPSLDQAMGSMQHESDQSLEAAISDRTLGAVTQAGRQDSDQSLQSAFDRISFLISHKAMAATLHERQDGIDDGAVAERVHETKKWMMETREGLLNLVGEVQGHLWAIEKGR